MTVSAVLLPAAFALVAWWAGTGLVLFLDGLPRRTYRWTMGAGVVLAVAAVAGLVASSASATPAAAYCAFACALVVWAVLELAHYLGFLTGTHRRPCPEGCAGVRRFALALGTSIHHELAALGAALVVHVATAGGANRVGAWTFWVLLLARWSTKLNLFLGVPNFHREWLPGHLDYLASYVRTRPMNGLFPLSVTVATALLALGLARLGDPGGGDFERAGVALVATLLALALLEHWFLVLPWRDSALWRWALTERSAARRLAPRTARGGADVPCAGVERPLTGP